MIRACKSAGPLGFRRFAMRRCRFREWALGCLATLAVIGALQAPSATGADAASATIASDSVSQSLRRLLDGAAPSGVNDLKAMQGHVQKLSDAIKKCTVGVRVDPAWGSGVIISKDGYVLTAAHVAGRPNRDCIFTLSDGTEVEGKTLGMFRTLDAGLMKITKKGDYPYAELCGDGKVKEGKWCIAMGQPGGYQAERGAVLRLGRVLLVHDDAITTNCTLVGGDSGGPLFDMDGRVIGINSRIAEQLYNNMHVPVDVFHEETAWNRMLKGDMWGHMPGQNPWLGVKGDEDPAQAKIAAVTPGSPAERQGLKAGDVVLSLDEKPIKDFRSLTRAIEECSPNESVKLKLRRGGDTIEFHVRLGKR